MSQKFEESKSTGMHSQLARLIGDWEGTATVWFEPSKPEDESPISGSMRSTLDGRFIIHEYSTSFKGTPIKGMAIIGFHLELRKFQVAWIDSFHNGTALMFSEGKRDDPAMSVLGGYTYVTPEIEQHWGWRTEIEIKSDDEIIFTAYNISPEGEEALATQTVYTRKGDRKV